MEPTVEELLNPDNLQLESPSTAIPAILDTPSIVAGEMITISESEESKQERMLEKIKSTDIQKKLDKAGITEEKQYQLLAEGLTAEMTVPILRESKRIGFRKIPDFKMRYRYLELVFKLKKELTTRGDPTEKKNPIFNLQLLKVLKNCVDRGIEFPNVIKKRLSIGEPNVGNENNT